MTVLRHGGRLGRSPRPVDVASVVNSVDVHGPLIFVDPVDDAILPDPRTTPTGQFAPERVAYLLVGWRSGARSRTRLWRLRLEVMSKRADPAVEWLGVTNAADSHPRDQRAIASSLVQFQGCAGLAGNFSFSQIGHRLGVGQHVERLL